MEANEARMETEPEQEGKPVAMAEQEHKGDDEEEAKQCVECEDQVAEIECLDCQEYFCRPCRDQQHRKGKRRQHKSRPLLGKLVAQGMGTVIGQGWLFVLLVTSFSSCFWLKQLKAYAAACYFFFCTLLLSLPDCCLKQAKSHRLKGHRKKQSAAIQ